MDKTVIKSPVTATYGNQPKDKNYNLIWQRAYSRKLTGNNAEKFRHSFQFFDAEIKKNTFIFTHKHDLN